MNSRVALFAVLAASLAAQPLPLSTPEKEGLSTQRLKRMHASLEQLIDEGKRSGAASMVIRNGRIVDWKTFGVRDVESRQPIEKDTIYALYSMTKPIVSVAAMILVEEGKLALNDRVDKYAPDFANMRLADGTPPKRPITVRHLLTHTSGMPYGSNEGLGVLYAKANLFAAPTLKGFVERVATLPLAFHPGDKYLYGISTDVLGYVIEVASGMPFDRFLAARILEPLKMNDTFFEVPASKLARTARVHALKDGKLVTTPIPNRNFPSGGAGLYSTIGDYARFAQMLANGGKLDGAQILSRKTVELMMANHLTQTDRPTMPNNPSEGFGLGGSVRIQLEGIDRPGSIGEWGWAGAAGTWFRIDPKEKLALVLMLQHMPMDAPIQQRFATLVYQSLID